MSHGSAGPSGAPAPGPASSPSERSLGAGLLERWTEPSPEVRDPADRRRARMVAALSLPLAVLAFTASLVVLFLQGSLGREVGIQALGVSGALAGFLAVPVLLASHILARGPRWRGGAVLMVGATLLLALVTVVAGAWSDGGQGLIVYLAIPVILAGAFLERRGTLATAGLALAGAGSLPVVVPGMAYPQIHASLIFLAMVVALVLVFSSVRARDLSQLVEQADRVAQAEQIAGLGTWSLDPATEKMSWSDQMYRIYGFQPGTEVDLEAALEGVPPEDAKTLLDMVAGTLAGSTETLGPVEYRLERSPGEQRFLLARGRVVRDAQGQVQGLVGTVQDLTDRRRLEIRFEQLLEAAPDAHVIVDAQGTIVLVNEQTETLFGWERDELLGQAIEVLVPEALASNHVAQRNAYMEAPDKRPMGLNMELYGKHRDGQLIPVEIGLAPLQTEDGFRVMAAIRDMTERAKIKEELRAYARRLEVSNEDWERFAYAVSHDLQEPIRMVNSYLQLLQRRYGGELDEEADTYIGFATEGAQRMGKLIQGLLEYSRVDTQGGGQDQVDSQAVLDSALNALQVTIQDREAVITHEPLPTVWADEAQLGQLLQNLVANAVKFVPEERTPRVHISAHKEGEAWRFEVTDNGIGIEPEHRDRIFVIFRRLNPRDTYQGEGIGLAICKKIVERHGGEIGVEAAPEQGSTFWFTLPAQPPEPSVSALEGDRAGAGTSPVWQRE